MKKLNKLIAVVIALAVMAMMCAVSAFAAGTVASDGKVYLTKTLNIAPGLTAPEDFTFTFTPVTVDDVEYDNSNMPAITSVSTEGIQGTKATDGDIIKNVEVDLSDVAWTHAGEYVYTVAETNAGTEGMTYDDAVYTLTIRVANDGNGGFTVAEVQVTDENNTKTDPTKPTDEDDSDEDDGKKEDGVNFDNTYVKVADETPTGLEEDEDTTETESKASYVLTKTVTGAYGDQTKQFSFVVALDTSATNVADEDLNITYTKVDADGNETTVDPSGFTLAHGEKLIIEGAPVGTTIDVTENLADDDAAALKYTATVAALADGADVAVDTTTAGVDAVITDALIGEGVNNAAYTNENTEDDDNPLTGVLMNNLPYIVLAMVAVGGLVAYVVIRRKANDEA